VDKARTLKDSIFEGRMIKRTGDYPKITSDKKQMIVTFLKNTPFYMGKLIGKNRLSAMN
jgi:hypothetical protein